MSEVFCLTDENGKLLSPAVQATALAKYSRSPGSAREILSELTDAKADAFQEKWVVGYGHSSVAELSNIPVCFEGVSIVASKIIESWQRPGYSEKSTRYQKFSGESFVTPPECSETMKAFARKYYEAYDRLLPRVTRHCAELMGKDPNDPKSLEDRVVKARAFDNVRYLLPAGTGTNVACVANMRDICGMIAKMKGHPNNEIKDLGNKLQMASEKICPSLVKHVEPDSSYMQVKKLGQTSPKFDPNNPDWYVDVFKSLKNPELEQASLESCIADFYGMSWSSFEQIMDNRGAYDQVPDIFKLIRIKFDILMDYGAFRDLQRHRRCEQYVELLSSDYGYVVPDDIRGTDMESEYREAMESIQVYGEETIIYNPHYYQYMIPLGYLHRSVFDMDLKELYYVSELRTKPQGHISYRRVAYEMFRIGSELYPKLMKWCRVTKPDFIGAHN